LERERPDNSVSKQDKRILGKIFALHFSDHSSSSYEHLASLLGIELEDVSKNMESLEIRGLVSLESHDVPELTAAGRKSIKVIFAGGSFDIIHPGHIETLEKSKALGDVLIVSVARNSTFEKNKKRKPFFDETIRRDCVLALRCVDAALLGSEKDIFETVEKVGPDVIALGYDQSHQESAILDEVKKRGLQIVVVRLTSSIPMVKTSKLFSENPDLTKEF
jgi:cytidyltransferase-like protein